MTTYNIPSGGSISVPSSLTVRAVATAPGYTPSAEVDATYTIGAGGFPTIRSKYAWPGGSAVNGNTATALTGSLPSLWNQSIGSGATWYNPNLVPSGGSGWIRSGINFNDDFDFVLVDITQPRRNVLLQNNPLAWGTGFNLCSLTGTILGTAFVPSAFYGGVLMDSTNQAKKNNDAAIIQADGDTVWNTEQLYICSPGVLGTGASLSQFSGSYTSNAAPYNSSVKGDLRFGARGGSHLSAFGGTLRKWEIAAKGPIYHALRTMQCGSCLSGYGGGGGVEVIGFNNTLRYTWPAQNGDGNRADQITNKYVRYGALFAIPGSIVLSTTSPSFASLGYSAGFESPFGLIIAKAIQNYGFYVCDTNGGATQADGAFAWCGEASPSPGTYGTGKAIGTIETYDDVLLATWGHRLACNPYTSPTIAQARAGDSSLLSKWARDNDRIVTLLQIVTNNAPTSIGGGGTPRMSPAPPFSD
jgi:hypothetical protein